MTTTEKPKSKYSVPMILEALGTHTTCLSKEKTDEFKASLQDVVDKCDMMTGKLLLTTPTGGLEVNGSVEAVGLYGQYVITACLAVIRRLTGAIKMADGQWLNAVNTTDESIVNQLLQHVFVPKNTDYGDAFAQFGVAGIMVRVNDKARRMSSLMRSDKALVQNESMVDTVVDICVYVMLAVMLANEARKQLQHELKNMPLTPTPGSDPMPMHVNREWTR